MSGGGGEHIYLRTVCSSGTQKTKAQGAARASICRSNSTTVSQQLLMEMELNTDAF